MEVLRETPDYIITLLRWYVTDGVYVTCVVFPRGVLTSTTTLITILTVSKDGCLSGGSTCDNILPPASLYATFILYTSYRLKMIHGAPS